MKHIYHANKFYIWAYRVPWYARYMFTIGIWLFLLAFWWFFIHTSLLSTINWYTQQTKMVHKQNRILKNLTPKIASLQNQLKELQSAREKITSVVHNAQMHPIVQSLLKDAQHKQISIDGYTAGTTRSKEWYQKTGVNLQLQGARQQILSFLQDMQKNNALISFKNVSCNCTAPNTIKINLECSVVDIIA